MLSFNSVFTLAQEGNGIGEVVFLIVYIGLIGLVLAGVWKTLVKAGQPGWACIVPFYNAIVLLRIADKPAWWLILMFIPFLSLIHI